MGNLSPRPGRTPGSRRKREQRAYSLTLVGGTAAVVAVGGLILAIAGVVGSGVWVIAAVVAVVWALWVRRTLSRLRGPDPRERQRPGGGENWGARLRGRA